MVIRKYISLILIVIFSALTVLIVRFRKPAVKYTVIERNVNDAEWANAKQAINNLLDDLRNNPDNDKAKLNLAYAYIQEGRVAGNHAYYDPAALSLCDEILKKDPTSYNALCAKATVLLSQHHFSDALPIAQKAIELNPYSSTAYGILTDSYVELGQYEKAISSADKMVSIRPDIRSYSRISYLREIMGDNKGAIEVMKLAVSSGYPGYEETEWTRCHLGRLYENIGDLQNAEVQYRYAISERPYYSFALAGLGRIEKANHNYQKAIEYFEQAKSMLDDFSFSQELSELYLLSNQLKKSSEYAWKTIGTLTGTAGNQNASSHGHYADRELAYAYLDVYRYDLALAHALTEYERRPDNIDVNQALAWVYYKLREYDKAELYIARALKTHSQNPVLVYQAGLIHKSAGRIAEGEQLLTDATALNPFLSPVLKWENKSSSLAMK